MKVEFVDANSMNTGVLKSLLEPLFFYHLYKLYCKCNTCSVINFIIYEEVILISPQQEIIIKNTQNIPAEVILLKH